MPDTQDKLDLLRHDLMTPISAAKGALELLTRRADSLTLEQRERLFETLARSLDTIERLARNVGSDREEAR